MNKTSKINSNANWLMTRYISSNQKGQITFIKMRIQIQITAFHQATQYHNYILRMSWCTDIPYTEDVLCCQNAMKNTVTEVSLELSMTPSVESSSHLLVLSHIPRMSVAVGMLWPWTMKRGGKNNNSPLLDVFILHIGNCLCIHLLHLMLWPLVVHLHLHTRSHFC